MLVVCMPYILHMIYDFLLCFFFMFLFLPKAFVQLLLHRQQLCIFYSNYQSKHTRNLINIITCLIQMRTFNNQITRKFSLELPVTMMMGIMWNHIFTILWSCQPRIHYSHKQKQHPRLFIVVVKMMIIKINF
jgi:hypothetical protein